MPADSRFGLVVYPGSSDGAASRDAQQWAQVMVATRDWVLGLMGGAGIYRGLETDPTTVVAASAGAPLYLIGVDDAGHLHPARFTSDQAIVFNVTSGTLNLYLVPDLVGSRSPDMGVLSLTDWTFVADTSAPDHALLLGSGSVTASAFTSWTEDASARVGQLYTVTNYTEDRTFDADTVAVAELADVVATLLDDLQSGAKIQAAIS